MEVDWRLFANLAEAADREVTVEVPADATVGDALDELLAGRDDLADLVLDAQGEVRDHINVLRNGENVFTEGNGLTADVENGDELALFPPVSGG